MKTLRDEINDLAEHVVRKSKGINYRSGWRWHERIEVTAEERQQLEDAAEWLDDLLALYVVPELEARKKS